MADEPPLNVKVLVNFAPQNSRSATLQPLDTSALTAILRNISRDPRIGKFTIVAFNLQEHRVVYRQDNAEKIDFPALGEALDSISPGTVDLKRLEPEEWRDGIPHQADPGGSGVYGQPGRGGFRWSQGAARRRACRPSPSARSAIWGTRCST